MNTSEDGTTDLDGDPRALPGRLTCGAPEPAEDQGYRSLSTPTLAPPARRRYPQHGDHKDEDQPTEERVSFSFQAIGSASGFECMLIKPRRKHHKPPMAAAFSSCNSPKTYKHLQPGSYEFEVRALSSRRCRCDPATRS